jgi:hypothetical protein
VIPAFKIDPILLAAQRRQIQRRVGRQPGAGSRPTLLSLVLFPERTIPWTRKLDIVILDAELHPKQP